MIKHTYILLTLMFFLSIGCAGPYTIKDNGATIEISEDGRFAVILEGNINSSDVWELASKPDFIELEQPVTKTKKGETIEYTFNFKAIGDGEEHLQISYTDGDGVKQSFNATIIVGTMGRIESN